MRRTSLILLLVVAAAMVLAGCLSPGSDELSKSRKREAQQLEEQGVTPAQGDEGAADEQPADEKPSDTGAGTGEDGGAPTPGPEAKGLFVDTCGSCHTLGAAGTSGTVGPDLDEAAPDYEHVLTQIANGGGAMPPGLLEGEDAEQVAAYVAANVKQ